jgi:gamma-glutamyl:cysteine ligase YbdK (ATP-grasp superfamily)
VGEHRLPIPAFAAVGIELEYMIVERETLDVRPIAERLLASFAGHETADVERGPMGWSNELVRHVVEVKNREPASTLASLIPRFQDEIRAADALLAEYGARLMPTAMHPWMDPARETTLWDGEIYRTYDRIYDCRAHGWANLQSMHVNLPFAGDGEFARLHAAIRLILPLLPALAASSPIADGQPTGLLDFRLDAYRNNCRITPSVCGRVVPETIETEAEYDAKLLRPMFDEIARYDREGVLAHEWLNSRGAIARFDRSAIEIRVVDAQECPHVDLAIAAATRAVVHALYDECYAPLDEQQAVPTETLEAVLLATMRDADLAVVDDPDYLHALGMPAQRRVARDIWRPLLEEASNGMAWWQPVLEVIIREGPLARRILSATGTSPDRARLREVYGALCQCLHDGRMFHGEA